MNGSDRDASESKGRVRPKFAADEMLGSLARWLRVMGYDTTYERDRDDSDILKAARVQGRILLTRDKMLAIRAGEDGLYIDHHGLDGQLGMVIGTYSLSLDEHLTRCAACNGELEIVSADEAAKGGVPNGSLDNCSEFFRCCGCGKFYWKGSHWINIRKKVDVLSVTIQVSSR